MALVQRDTDQISNYRRILKTEDKTKKAKMDRINKSKDKWNNLSLSYKKS